MDREASHHLADALALALEMGHPRGIAQALYWLGMAAILENQAEHGVMLVGASARIREEHGGGFVAEDVGLAEITDPLTLAREALHQEEIDRQWAKGWATHEQDLLSLVKTTSFQ